MTLTDAIQEIGLDKTDAEIVSALGATVARPYNTQRWSYAGVATQFGVAAAEGIGQAMRDAGLITGEKVYAGDGIDLSLQETQNNLDTISAAIPALAAVCGELKLIGRPVGPRWYELGLEELPTEQQVADARRKLVVANKWTALCGNVVEPMLATATWEEIKAAIAAAE